MAESAVRARVEDASGWIVQRQLGRGQYGTAYLVEMGSRRPPAGGDRPKKLVEASLGDQAVAKVVGLEFLPEKEHSLAFQEVELMRNLKHPCIVMLTDHFLTEASLELVIVMDWCDGGDLRNEVKRRGKTTPADHIPEDQIMMWFIQLALALNYIHQRHILHRDLKSSNIFLITGQSQGYRVKIGDFGISRVLEGTVDVAATVVGTPFYMSPEVCKAEPYGYKSDIWALGCVLYEMCMLKHAFESQSLLGLVYKIVSETHPDIPVQYSDDLRKLLDRVLEKSQYDRPSGKEVMADPYVRRFVAGATADFSGILAEAAPPLGAPTEAWAPAEAASPKPPDGARAAAVADEGPAPVMDIPPGSPAAHAGLGGPQERPVRREWSDPPFVAAAPPSLTTEEGLRAKVLIGRMRRALTMRPQNWLQVFASFDQKGDGQLPSAEFERAVTSLALGLSDEEIQEVRASLQSGKSSCVPVDSFGAALHRVPPEVKQLEEWGQCVLMSIVSTALREADAKGIAPGAQVRVQGLQTAAGQRLNGCEGVVDKWDMQGCRWVVRITEGAASGMMKSIHEEKLRLLRPASGTRSPPATAGGGADTSALYRLLCEGGETALSEDRFLLVVRRLAPKMDDAGCRRLLWLLPKSPEGRVDVPEALAELAMASPAAAPAAAQGQAAPAPGPAAVGSAGAGRGRAAPGPNLRQASGAPLHAPFGAVPAGGFAGPCGQANGPLPGTVLSPRAQMPAAQSPGDKATIVSHQAPGVAAEAALLRLGQRALGSELGPGPGLEVLRLFAARPEELRLDELLDAVSVLPLGLSRAEVQGVFSHLRRPLGAPGGPPAGGLPFAALAAAAEGAHAAGVPSEAAGLERVSRAKLGPALHRLSEAGGGRASPQDFRVALMQAEPYLTHSQLEWLVALTDKDGEGRLFPRSLLARLGDGSTPMSPAARGSAVAPAYGLGPRLLPRRPAGPRAPVAPGLPRPQVAAPALDRIRRRLAAAEPRLTLERVLGLFLEGGHLSGGAIGRDALAGLLGHLRLGVSAAEADELFDFLGGGRPASGGGAEASLQLSSLYEALARVAEPEAQGRLTELHEAAARRLQGGASAFACTDGSDWLPEGEFRRCLRSALGLGGALGPGSVAAAATLDVDLEAEEERLLLLAEKNAAGDVRWRGFVQEFCASKECADFDDWGEKGGTRMIDSPKKVILKNDRPDPGTTAQSWRSMKVAQIEAAKAPAKASTEVTPFYEASPKPDPKVKTPMDFEARSNSWRCCRRRR